VRRAAAHPSSFLKQIKDNDVKFVDLRFTDPRGKMQHVTMDVSCVDEDIFADGVMFDGSSIAGWKAINESDMVLMPDTTTAHMDPFFAQSTMAIFCDILDPITGEAYSRDPRTTAKKAEAYLQASGLGDTVYIGPEPEFFIFDDVQVQGRSLQHRLQARFLGTADQMTTPTTKPATWATVRAPRAATSRSRRSTCQDMRSEMLTVLAEMGLTVEKHHHEVALPSTSCAWSSTP
jgi:glutamine synthetase